MNTLEEHRKAVGENIKKIRNFKGLYQEDVAKKAGIDKDHYGRIERGQINFSVDALANIAKVLDVSVEELFMKDGNLLTLRFVISEHNIETLKEVVGIVKDLIEKK